jgi:hypothetical protein
MNLKIIDSYWFNNVGIVICQDTVTGKRKAYIGVGLGINQQADEEHIKSYGCKLTNACIVAIQKPLNAKSE